MKKILFILSNLCIGGAEKQTVALANGLAKKGFEVVIVSLGNGDQLANEVCDSIQVVFLNKRSFVDFVLSQCLKKEIKSVKPDFLIMVNLYTMLYVYFSTIQFANFQRKNQGKTCPGNIKLLREKI